MFSERPIVGEWKDGTMVFFSDRFALEWSRRMKDVGGREGKFRTFDEKRLVEIASKYGARYLVFPADVPLHFRRVYANRDFAVYEAGVLEPAG